MTRSTHWKKSHQSIGALLVALLGLLHDGSLAQASGCDEGVIRLPDRNGTIQICSALAGQVPQLTQQLKAMALTLGSQQTQIRELTRLVKGLNNASKEIGEERQAQMLKTLSAELARTQRGGDDRTRQMFTTLTQQLEDLQTQLVTALSNKSTKEATQASLQGNIGESISKLEFASASRMLDELSAKLNVIDGRVQDVKSDTSEIRKKLEQMQLERLQQIKKDEEFLAEMERQSEERMMKLKEDAQKQEQERLESPGSFGSIFAFGSSTQPFLGQPSPWGLMLTFSLKDRSWEDADLVVIGRPENGKPWQINLSQFIKTSKKGGEQEIEGGVNAEPADLTVCLTVFDPLRQRRMTLSQNYEAKITKRYLQRLSWEKDSQFGGPKLRLTPSPSPQCSTTGISNALFVLNQDIDRQWAK